MNFLSIEPRNISGQHITSTGSFWKHPAPSTATFLLGIGPKFDATRSSFCFHHRQLQIFHQIHSFSTLPSGTTGNCSKTHQPPTTFRLTSSPCPPALWSCEAITIEIWVLHGAAILPSDTHTLNSATGNKHQNCGKSSSTTSPSRPATNTPSHHQRCLS